MAIEVRDGVEGKVCSKCRDWKPVDDFAKFAGSSDGRQGYCKPCMRSYNKVSNKELRKGGRYHSAAVLAGLRRRARVKGKAGTFTQEEFVLLAAVYGGVCLDPGCAGSYDKLVKDHVVPISWPEGYNRISNVQPLCGPCNGRKSNSHAEDYRPDGGDAALAIERLKIYRVKHGADRLEYAMWAWRRVKMLSTLEERTEALLRLTPAPEMVVKWRARLNERAPF